MNRFRYALIKESAASSIYFRKKISNRIRVSIGVKSFFDNVENIDVFSQCIYAGSVYSINIMLLAII